MSPLARSPLQSPPEPTAAEEKDKLKSTEEAKLAAQLAQDAEQKYETLRTDIRGAVDEVMALVKSAVAGPDTEQGEDDDE